MKINTRFVMIKLAEQGMTQSAYAKKCGIRQDQISYTLRRGTAEPKTVGKLAAGLGVSVEEVLAE